MDRSALDVALRQLGLSASEDQMESLAAFEDNLYAANATMNLTRVPREENWSRHFLDSVLFHDLIASGARVLDIGTGPGFPAWPLACLRPDLDIVALDSNGKMLRFLAQNPLPNLSILEGRAEEVAKREAFDVVTGRAVAPLPIQMEISAAPCKVGGCVLPMRTPADRGTAEAFEGEGLGLQLERIVERPLAGSDALRIAPVFRKTGRSDRRYPRAWAEIKRKPLR